MSFLFETNFGQGIAFEEEYIIHMMYKQIPLRFVTPFLAKRNTQTTPDETLLNDKSTSF